MTTYQIAQGIAFRLVGGEAFIVTPNRAMHRVRSKSGVTILAELRSGPQTRDALVASMRAQFRGDSETITATVDAFVAQLVAQEIITVSQDAEGFDGDG